MVILAHAADLIAIAAAVLIWGVYEGLKRRRHGGE